MPDYILIYSHLYIYKTVFSPILNVIVVINFYFQKKAIDFFIFALSIHCDIKYLSKS